MKINNGFVFVMIVGLVIDFASEAVNAKRLTAKIHAVNTCIAFISMFFFLLFLFLTLERAYLFLIIKKSP